MAKITPIPTYFLGANLLNPKVLGDKVVEIITAITEKKTVTQTVAITAGVTINAQSGIITTVAATLAADTTTSFTVTNSKVFADSTIQLTAQYAGTALSQPSLAIASISNGSFVVKITNVGTAALNAVVKINFNII